MHSRLAILMGPVATIFPWCDYTDDETWAPKVLVQLQHEYDDERYLMDKRERGVCGLKGSETSCLDGGGCAVHHRTGIRNIEP